MAVNCIKGILVLKEKFANMGFYDLSKEERIRLVSEIDKDIFNDLSGSRRGKIYIYFSDDDTYIRKSAYLVLGRIFLKDPDLRESVIELLNEFILQDDFKIRQTVINAAGEIGKKHFEIVRYFFDAGLFDQHHSVRNAVIGSVKKMGEVNPKPVLLWAGRYLHHPDKEIRREICHGIELRGRKRPEDILPLLRQLQFDKTVRVRNTLVHVIGQIAYKKGCLQKVLIDLKSWENEKLVLLALNEIVDVHHRYAHFATLSQAEAMDYISKAFGDNWKQ